jgi:DNA-binding PadR family transcriptional regulator
MNFDRDLVRSMAEPVVLSLVAERPMYGYEIIKVVNDRTDQAFQWKEGTLYPCLHRLEGQGMIRGEWSTAESGKERKYYSITRKGKGRLRSKISEWKSFSGAVNTLLAADLVSV